jgi:endonuclease-8
VPEGDSVWLACHTLHRALAGKVVRSSDLRTPALATADLSGATLLEVVPRGKHLLMRFDNGFTLHSHLRMEGSWNLQRPADRWRGGPHHQIRAVLDFEDVVAVGRLLPVLDLVPTSEEASVIGHLGPDLLDPHVDLDEVLRRLLLDPNHEIGPALLDQRTVAGIGNLYKNEVLFLERLTPWVRVSEVPSLERLVDRARVLLDVNKERFEQITTADARPGHHTWVFERRGLPCRRCESAIMCTTQEPFARLSYWCPRCQLGPAPTIDENDSRRGIQRR